MEKSISSREQQILCRLLKQIRKGNGLSQAELAQLLDEPQSFVSRYERGQQRLDILEVRHVCRAVGVSLPDFSQRLESLFNDS
ncbi:MAG: helix-turn-helix domain-containing protein [Pirellulaceae bacterium]